MSRRRRLPKKKCQEIHAKKRFLERYNGFDFTEKISKEFIRMIQNGLALCIEKQSNRVSIFKVFYDNKDFNVVYDKKSKVVVTVLPKTERIMNP